MCILHVLDSSSPPDACAMIALLVSDEPARHRVIALGHRSTAALAAGLGEIEWVTSVGWADPSGWRGVRRAIAESHPTHVHIWGGGQAATACALAGFDRPRVATFAERPAAGHMPILRYIARHSKNWTWIGTSPTVAGLLKAGGIDGVRVIPPGIGAGARFDRMTVRQELGIPPEDGPIILLAGEGGSIAGGTRHDFGLWTGAILQQFFPKIRIVVREDSRGRMDYGLDRLVGDLPDEQIAVVASRELSWSQLYSAADLLLVSADGPIAMGSVLEAMAAGVPVIGTPIASVRDVIKDGVNGLLSREIKPRAVAARVEEFFSDSELGPRLIREAQGEIQSAYAPARMVQAYKMVCEEA